MFEILTSAKTTFSAAHIPNNPAMAQIVAAEFNSIQLHISPRTSINVLSALNIWFHTSKIIRN